MLPAELRRNRLEIIEHHVASREVPTQVMSDVTGEVAIASAEEQMMAEPASAVAVDGDDDVDVIEEAGEGLGVRGVESRRREMGPTRRGLGDGIEGSARPLRHVGSHGIRGPFEIPTVEGHHPEAPGDFTPFDDVGTRQKFSKLGHFLHPSPVWETPVFGDYREA